MQEGGQAGGHLDGHTQKEQEIVEMVKKKQIQEILGSRINTQKDPLCIQVNVKNQQDSEVASLSNRVDRGAAFKELRNVEKKWVLRDG